MKTVGILGSGQLARMLIQSSPDTNFLLYAPEVTFSMQQLAPFMEADFDDKKMLSTFINKVDVITYESENIDVDIIRFIETKKNVQPSSAPIAVAQDRFNEKDLFAKLAIDTNTTLTVDTKIDLQVAGDTLGFPFILKTRSNGYDGKGQIRIKGENDLKTVTHFEHCLAEAYVPFDFEVSVVAVKSLSGKINYYPLTKNQHQEGILIKSFPIESPGLYEKAKQAVTKILNHFNYVGILAVEFFVVGDTLLANEMAPRVHNSGHWTIEGSQTSQFRNHVLAITGREIESTKLIRFTTMYNCLGSLPNMALTENMVLHDYKKTPRPKRKVGHINIFQQSNEKTNTPLKEMDKLFID